jgi:hypothetical protein
MKRKIKFRRFTGSDFIYDDENNCCVFWGGLSEKEEESLSQFTGFYDKDCQEIYEGDILQNDFINNNQPINVVKFDTICGEWRCGGPAFWMCISKIIGNIYQNPEIINNQN